MQPRQVKPDPIMKIALDVLGGDNAPISCIEGAINYLNSKEEPVADIMLVGNEVEIKSALKSYTYDKSKIQILHLQYFFF